MADLLFVFAADKLKGTPLEAAGFNPSSDTMQQWWHFCEETLQALPADDDEPVSEPVRPPRVCFDAAAVSNGARGRVGVPAPGYGEGHPQYADGSTLLLQRSYTP
jgi:hypothetical protein